ncbi:MAG: hypothetical protein R3F65_06820 [bacterium]
MAWPELIDALSPPPPPDDGGLIDPAVVDGWGAAIAAILLRRAALVAGGVAHRLREVELYLRAPHHPDPFAHAHPVQQRVGGWYFHRAGASYRGGTFKGLDLSCGGPGVFGGVLIRSVEGEGPLVDGSCNTVDHLLRRTGHDSVAALDGDIAGRRVDDTGSPLHLAEADAIDDAILATPRVGLTLKRAAAWPEMPAYIGRRLRFLTRPGAIRKGRTQTIVALYAAGEGLDAIAAQTGSPRAAVARVVAAYGEGHARPEMAPYLGRATTSAELCRVLGAWDRVYSPDSNWLV